MDDLTEKVALTIQSYPTILPTRTHVLTQMYIVGGNGYDWKEGKLVKDEALVDKSEDNRKRSKKEALKNVRETYENRKDTIKDLPEFVVLHKFLFRELVNLKRYRYCVFNSEDLAKGSAPKWIRYEPVSDLDPDRKKDWCHNEDYFNKMQWYPFTKYANVLNIPENADEVYAAGAVEVLLKKIDHPEWWSEEDSEFDFRDDQEIIEIISDILGRFPSCKEYVRRY